MPPWGGVPYFRRRGRSRTARVLPRLKFRATEDLLLYILAVNADGARAQLEPVHRQVVAVRAHAGRIGEQVGHVVFVRRSKRVMRRHPLRRCQVVLEHRKVDNPNQVEYEHTIHIFAALGIGFMNYLFRYSKCTVPVRVLLRQLSSEVACGRVDIDLSFAQPAFRIWCRWP